MQEALASTRQITEGYPALRYGSPSYHPQVPLHRVTCSETRTEYRWTSTSRDVLRLLWLRLLLH
jgi:hypothetical protein